jgi:hypothetical protein
VYLSLSALSNNLRFYFYENFIVYGFLQETLVKKGLDNFLFTPGHRRHSAIEPVFSHLKASYRLGRNFHIGTIGDDINLLLAAAAMNFKRVMNLWSSEAIIRWLNAIKFLLYLRQTYAQFAKMSFCGLTK